MKKIITQHTPPIDAAAEILSDHPVLHRVYQVRGIKEKKELEHGLKELLPYHQLKNMDKAVERLVQALQQQEHVMIVGDFDADGATSTAIAVRALRQFGLTQVNYLVPNRFKYGYGLTPEIVVLAAKQQPQVIVTVDNGINSEEGVNAANELGIDVVITDHHLPGESLPKAYAIVNPNQPEDQFLSKNLAGCGVIFYVMLALRARLRELNWFEEKKLPEPNMASFLDIVALGTVADVVPLDKNNRILVQQGLRRIRSGQCILGIKALLDIGKRELKKVVASDLGFAVAPRLNAAGRLDDMSLGIECLLSDDLAASIRLANELDRLNKERRVIENDMKQQAFKDLTKLKLSEKNMPMALCLFDKDWHQGVIGILAGRVKEKYHRPTIVFAPGDEGEIKGSARSIPGLHIRDLLESVTLVDPTLIKRFGGHAMAAGLTIDQDNFKKFQAAFLSQAEKCLDEKSLRNEIICDGELSEQDFKIELAHTLREAGPWGQHFPEPIFTNRFKLIDQRLVGEHHLKLTLGFLDQLIEGILFNADTSVWPNYRCEHVQAAYRLDINEFRGRCSLQLLIEHLEPA